MALIPSFLVLNLLVFFLTLPRSGGGAFFLTMLMGKIMQKIAKPEPPKAAAAPVPAAPAVPADGLTAEVKIAILAALQQEPGFDLARVSAIDIRKL